MSISTRCRREFAFALPVTTPPNAIVYGSGYIRQKHVMPAGVVLTLLMTGVLTVRTTALFSLVRPAILW